MKRKSLLTLSALALSASVLSPMATQAAGSYSSNTIVVNASNCEDLQNILSQYNMNMMCPNYEQIVNKLYNIWVQDVLIGCARLYHISVHSDVYLYIC